MTSLLLDVRRRSLSESCKLRYLASLGEDVDESAALLAPDEPVDDHHPLVLAARHDDEPLLRSKSESFICTAQGVVFEDAKSQYQTRLDGLMALAASSSSSQSNVLLAKKALRYRKVLERRRILE